MGAIRIKKKKHDLDRANEAFIYWLQDLRGYLLEADHENIDLRIIHGQFKRRLKRMKRRVGSVTRMTAYTTMVMSWD